MNLFAKKLGIVGGGQLGKMMILEAKRLGLWVAVLDPSPVCCAASICDELIVAPLGDKAAYLSLASRVDVVTYEWENISAAGLEQLNKPVYPSVASLKIIQSKLLQKQTLREGGVPVPEFCAAHSLEDIAQAGEQFGYPLVLKTLGGGYDGKGVAVAQDEHDAPNAYAKLGGGVLPLMAEAFVPYVCEISVIATRGIDGDRVIYPVAENHHENSILDTTIVPARISPAVEMRARDIADRVMEILQGVGTCCVEMFVTADGGVLVNEVAPRPHNSGHYTIEGCLCNQFENHVRAVCGLPLGDVSLRQPTVMVNLLMQSAGCAQLLGVEEAYRADPSVKVHFYGKPESKVGRKVGHITAIGDSVEDAIARAERARKIVRVTGK
ncbi:MAG: 5-(carboxyamino)imidazole ribonucleotide synthase [Oscillospiraceae bacterium]|nr:5-(carboxyamino)imidazole ribonucleotide synthase [Oscillospiraceae bacterium]